MSWYLDACVLVPLHITEARSAILDRLFNDDPQNLVISDLGIGEFSSSISRRVRMSEIGVDIAKLWIYSFDDWCTSDAEILTIEPVDVRTATEIVRRFELKFLMPDAIHAALCLRYDLTLVTFDKRLAQAAEVLGIGCLVPG